LIIRKLLPGVALVASTALTAVPAWAEWAEKSDGFEAALDRMALYRETGADLLFVESPVDLEQLQRILKALDGPCLVNLIDGGATPVLPASEFESLGYAACVMPVTSTHVIAKACKSFYSDLLKNGDLNEAAHHGTGFSEYTDLVGLPEQRTIEQTYIEVARDITQKFTDGRLAE